jgi:hypothetical protein
MRDPSISSTKQGPYRHLLVITIATETPCHTTAATASSLTTDDDHNRDDHDDEVDNDSRIPLMSMIMVITTSVIQFNTIAVVLVTAPGIFDL